MATLTTGASKMLRQQTLPGINNVTSSPGSVGGRWPCNSQDSENSVAGHLPAHASLSANQAKERDLLTSGTYGQPNTGSSGNADLYSCLVSKLQARLAWSGSILYRLTWKERRTPVRLRSYFRLAASVRRTSDNGNTGWPTTKASDSTSGPDYAVKDRQNAGGFWRNADWLYCRDEKWRPVESGTFPLAYGVPAVMEQLRSYGDAIVVPQAVQYIQSVMEALHDRA
jgi:hypothetical protein